MIDVNPLGISPVIFSLGPLAVRWYGLMYVIGFIIAGQLLKVLVRKQFFKVPEEKIDSLITTMILCMFLGARFFYVFIYNWDYYSLHVTELLSVWKGGLSYHGALVGLVVGGYIFSKRNQISWFQVIDSVCLAGAQGVFWGRIGNFINGELYGRVTDSPLGLVFLSGGPNPRHPSQLYEGLWEGLFLTIVLWFVFKKVRTYGIVTSIYLMGYAIGRFSIEFVREPDTQLGYYFGAVTMGQILCLLMFGLGVFAFFMSKKLNDQISP